MTYLVTITSRRRILLDLEMQGTLLCPFYVVLYMRQLRQEDLQLPHICKFDIIFIDQQRSHMGHSDLLALAVQGGSMLARLLHCWASKRS